MSDTEAVSLPRAGKQSKRRLANDEIDRRLAEAIKERTKLHATVSRLISAQERLSRLEQEINSLVQLGQRLNGGVSSTPIHLPTISSYAGHATDLSPEVGSIPAKQPHPTTGNVALEVKREGGFS